MPHTPEAEFPLLVYIDGLMEELRRHVPAALKEWDVDAIHQARVATRRLKAALDLLEDVLSKEQSKPFGRVLRRLRRRLGPLRDLDVMVEHLAEIQKVPAHAAAVDWLVQNLTRQRDAVREQTREEGSAARVLARLGAWWGLREEVLEVREAVNSLLAQSLHLQLDAFTEQANRLQTHAADPDASPRQDPHELRITGKRFRYTLEMAAVEGHQLPGSVLKGFKKMQAALGLWHDCVVLTERVMQVSLEQLLPHHDAGMQARVLNVARLLLQRSTRHLQAFSTLWAQRGPEFSQKIREIFPLTRPLMPTETDPHPPGSTSISVEEAPAADVVSPA